MEKPSKTPKNFLCECCDFTSSSNKDFNKHILTLKHSKRVKRYEKIQKNPNLPQFICDDCGSVYKHNSGLWRHKHTCKSTKPLETDVKSLTNMVMELMKSNNELQKQMLEVCKNSNITNNINSHNKTFNLQLFLNEQCKDAMNMSEFVNNFEIQLSDLESVGELGYVEGITKQIVNKLNSMDIYKRPMHCSDAKRETIYIKDEDRWEKEQANNPKLRKAIKNISFNNMKLIGKWSDAYPESKSSESRLNDKYMKLVKQTTGGDGEIGESEDKIIRRIAKEIIIEKI